MTREDKDTAYDLAQDVFFDVWTSRSKFAQVNSFSSYLFQMARFKAFNHFDRSAVKAMNFDGGGGTAMWVYGLGNAAYIKSDLKK
ncbi:MAG: hypothetical protein IJT74_01565 [Bacteroidales bacterium]|nr:hypothetical protein [Bacteroidales bacterium]